MDILFYTNQYFKLLLESIFIFMLAVALKFCRAKLEFSLGFYFWLEKLFMRPKVYRIGIQIICLLIENHNKIYFNVNIRTYVYTCNLYI